MDAASGSGAELPEVEGTASLAPPGWYSGDTHEHVQYCDDTLHPLAEIRQRMDDEDLNVACVLIWQRSALPFTQHVCAVTGKPDPSSGPRRILQYCVETSNLGCARFGHLIGLGIGPREARISRGSVAAGDCADMEGMGLENDGSGTLNAPVSRRFLQVRRAVCGYAHTIWSIGLYHPDGLDWNAELLATGFTTDARFLDPAQRLAVPNAQRLMGISAPPNSARAFLPLLGPMDAVLGNVQFVETVVVGLELPSSVRPPAHWTELYYKLLSAGVRIALSGGTDRACLMRIAPEDWARTYVLVDRTLSFNAWTSGLAAGRTSVSAGRHAFLRLSSEGREVGSEIPLASPDARATFTVEVRAGHALDDAVELVVGGVVHDTRAFSIPNAGIATLFFEDVAFSKSTWVAARLASQRAHTAAFYVYVDGRPIADPLTSESWMIWCDVVTKATLDHPELAIFGNQEQEALDLIAMARRAFQTLRDLDGFDPSWGVTRYGSSTPARRGPIAIGTTGALQSGQAFLLTCVNAPPLAQGFVRVSRASAAGTCEVDIRSWVDTSPAALIATVAAQSTRSGYAEVLVPPVPPGTSVVRCQFVWTNPPGSRGESCSGGKGARSASDALELDVH